MTDEDGIAHYTRLTREANESAQRQRSRENDSRADRLEIERLRAEVERLTKELSDATVSEEAMAAKALALSPHGTCACSYDKPGDLCLHHSPALVAERAEVERMTRMFEECSDNHVFYQNKYAAEHARAERLQSDLTHVQGSDVAMMELLSTSRGERDCVFKNLEDRTSERNSFAEALCAERAKVAALREALPKMIQELRAGLGAGGRDSGMRHEIELGGIILDRIQDRIDDLFAETEDKP